MRKGTCKNCGASIIWIPKPGGKSLPCDPTPVMYWKKAGAKDTVVTPNGMVIACRLEGVPEKATGIGYILHSAVCGTQ